MTIAVNVKSVAIMLMLTLISTPRSSAFLFSSTPVSRQQRDSASRRSSKSCSSSLNFYPCSNRAVLVEPTIDSITHYATPTDGEGAQSGDDEEDNTNFSKNPFAKINSFLDTPILDPNNKNDQGPVAEILKDFVRDEPQLAQVAFSGIVVTIFFVGLRIFNAVRYGGL
jgi:hypothetical protein